MAGCGCDSNIQFDGISQRYTTVLWVIIGINAVTGTFRNLVNIPGSISILPFGRVVGRKPVAEVDDNALRRN